MASPTPGAAPPPEEKKGENVRVGIRVRPLSTKENCTGLIHRLPLSIAVFFPRMNKKSPLGLTGITIILPLAPSTFSILGQFQQVKPI
jgi:hypothetical protein